MSQYPTNLLELSTSDLGTKNTLVLCNSLEMRQSSGWTTGIKNSDWNEAGIICCPNIRYARK